MASKSSSPGPNATPATPAKQTRSRKGSTPNQAEQGRAGSAGGVVLPKKTVAKAPASSEKKATATTATAAATPATDDTATAGAKTPRKRPRKLNKEPTSTPTDTTNSPTSTKVLNESLSNAELEALKARVRELEAKMEELYKTRGIVDSRAGRSPRRRGKGRKASSTEQVPQVKTTESNADTSGPRIQDVVDDNEEEEADEELVRLEGELEVARQDLEHYRPRMRRTRSTETDFVEEIPRTPSRARGGGERQVTLSGSYRIPIPSSVNLEDVQTIKSGVSAAQNLARSFLEQRRAAAAAARTQSTAAAAQDAQSSSSSRPSTTTTKVPPSKTRAKRNANQSTEVAVDNTGTKQSWGDWIGGYSLAISRAVSKIEHEAAVEAQMSGGNSGGARSARPQGSRRMSVPTSKKMAGKRPAAKPTLSAEQVHGLMS